MDCAIKRMPQLDRFPNLAKLAFVYYSLPVFHLFWPAISESQSHSSPKVLLLNGTNDVYVGVFWERVDANLKKNGLCIES